MTEQELRERLFKLIDTQAYGGFLLVDQILALIKEAGYVKLAENQSLPFRAPNCECVDCWSSIRYLHEIQDGEKMLKEGWRKVEI